MIIITAMIVSTKAKERAAGRMGRRAALLNGSQNELPRTPKKAKFVPA
jgi:hypothetical protein